jgi:hypothetical protein
MSPQLTKLACLAAMGLLLSACGKDFNGFGETEGFGGYTKGFGDVEGYGNKQVGLCSYTGGCMPEESEDGSTATGSYKSSRDRSGGAAADSSDSGSN